MTITLRQLADRNKFLLEFKYNRRNDPGSNVSLVLTRAEVHKLAVECHPYTFIEIAKAEEANNGPRV